MQDMFAVSTQTVSMKGAPRQTQLETIIEPMTFHVRDSLAIPRYPILVLVVCIERWVAVDMVLTRIIPARHWLKFRTFGAAYLELYV